jgi:PAS domain S-box-containing protein
MDLSGISGTPQIAVDKHWAKTFFENNCSAILLVEAKSGKIIDANPASVELFEYSQQKLCGLIFTNLLLAQEKEPQPELSKVLEGKLTHFTANFKTSSNELKQLECNCYAFQSDEKPLIAITFYSNLSAKTIKTLEEQNASLKQKIKNVESFYHLGKLFHAEEGTFEHKAKQALQHVLDRLNHKGQTGICLSVNQKNFTAGSFNPKSIVFLYNFNIEPETASLALSRPDEKLAPLDNNERELILAASKLIEENYLTRKFLIEINQKDELLKKNNQEYLKINHTLAETNKQLAQSEKHYKQLFNAMVSAFAYHKAIYNDQGQITDFQIIETNQAFDQFFNRTHEELMYKNISETLPAFNATMLEQCINVTKNRATFSSSNYLPEIDKYTHYLLYSPEPGYFAVIFEDITEKRKNELALNESTEKYKLIAENSADVLVMITHFSTLAYISPSGINVLGYTNEEIMASDYLSLVHPDDIEHYKKSFDDALKQKLAIFSVRYRFKHKSGKYIWLKSLVHISYDENNKMSNMLINSRDVSESVQYEEKLIKAKEKAEESDRLKTAFLANMSHEIRTPMNAIMGFSQLILNPNLDTDLRGRYAGIIRSRCSDLLHIIDDILDISRIESGQVVISEMDFKLGDLINEIQLVFDHKIKSISGKKIRLKPGKDQAMFDCTVKADYQRLKQIITNLIDNAIKFTNAGTIEFGCKLNNEANLLFYVKDSGIGIPIDKQALVFERFRQIDESITRSQGGNGLGLSICKGLVSLMSGNIGVESHEGKGSTFFFTIPYKPVSEKKKTKEKKTKIMESFNWKNKTLLIVEDDPANTNYLHEILEPTHIETLIAYNGLEALEIGLNRHIDLVLMDIRLPDMDGWNVTKRLKAMKKDLPIIAQTAFAMENDVQKSKEAGCETHLSKPFSPDELLQTMNRFLSKKKK